jgi:orotidine-5'-phosphate decarboxylase
VVQALLNFNLLKVDNTRSLPLKSGGKTDIYINLRDARNNPAALAFLAKQYAVPLRQLGVSRFVEVPSAVSCFAGPLAIETNLPYLTIRETPKAGRVGDAEVIGTSRFGENVVTIDDVITDGESKIAPHRKVQALGLNNLGLVVLVDRQQGWQQHLAAAGITNLPVYPGMTLHDVRRCLINDLGIMQRCTPAAEDSNRIVLALDGLSWEEILPVIDPLRTSGVILKVNDLLFDQGMHHLLPELSVYGRVMVDLKSHDIPNTVTNTCTRLAAHNPWAVTVHASGGPGMIGAACRALSRTNTRVLAVTVLTTMDSLACTKIYGKSSKNQVMRFAEMARNAGAHGLVCSPNELRMLRGRSEFDNMLLVTPGVRSPGVDHHDQSRTDTPQGAIQSGADFIVVGREVLHAEDPLAAFARIQRDITT